MLIVRETKVNDIVTVFLVFMVMLVPIKQAKHDIGEIVYIFTYKHAYIYLYSGAHMYCYILLKQIASPFNPSPPEFSLWPNF